MAILGMRGTGDWASSNERPQNFRDKILYLYPDSPAVLTALSGRLKSEVTNDPIFHIFEKGLPTQRVTLSAGFNDSATAAPLNGTTPAKNLNTTHVLMNERTLEVVWVTNVDADGDQTYDTLTIVRARGTTAAAAMLQNDGLLVIGTRNAEGADTPESISDDPTEVSNYTQIFRTSLKLTGTAKETYLRTGEIEKRLKRDAAERHAIEMEWAWIFGQKFATTSGGQAVRTTGGVLERIIASSGNVLSCGGYLTKSDWESFLEGVFEVPGGSSEKLCLVGNRALTSLNAMAQAYGSIQLTPTSSSFGMKFSQYETPYGTLQVKQHPLLSQNPSFHDWGVILDTRNFVYRPLKNRDTKFLQNRQGNGVDAIVHEFLTEAGIELRHPQTHGVFKDAAAFRP